MSKKVLHISMKHDYGDPSRALGYDYVHIYQSLEDSGFECTFFDYMAFLKKDSKEQLQKALIAKAHEVKPDVVIFSLYLDQIEEKTIAEIAASYKVLGLFFDDNWRRDFVVQYGRHMHNFTTTDPYGKAIYEKLGLKGKSVYFSYGHNPKHFFADRKDLADDITFVGSTNSTRAWVVRELQKSGFNVKTYGHGWENGVVDHETMVKIFQKSKISLNLSNSVQNNLSFITSSPRAFVNYLRSKKNKEQLKGRHVEINACGGFQISFYADGLNDLYTLGKEIEIYQDIDHLKFKLDYFLSYPEAREAIAAQGLARSNQYTYVQVMNRVFEQMGIK